MASKSNGEILSRVQRHNGWLKNKRRTTRSRKLKPLKCLFNFLVDYCNQSTLHGLRYIVEPGIHWIKRLIWALLFTLSVMCTILVISRLSARFQAAETSTVIETTNYPVSNLPFPSVTLCPSNRVNWQKALEMERHIIPTHDKEAVETYRELVTVLSTITFGDFDRLMFLKNHSLEAFQGINLTNFLRNIAPTMPELLSDCWWRDSDRDCDAIFESQRTEFGFCYSFNSETADFDPVTYLRELRPRRSGSRGDWTGLRFIVHLNKSNQPPKTNKAIGVTTFVGHPHTWPSSGRNTALGMLASMSVLCPSTYATDSVLQLKGNKLPCRPDNGEDYNQDYCLTVCRREYIVRRCGCNPSFMMPTGKERDCAVEDLICLANNNGTMIHFHSHNTPGCTTSSRGSFFLDLFNAYVQDGSEFFPNNNSGMNCSCPVQCKLYDYQYQITHTALRDSIVNDTIFVDVHYESSTMIRYRMDIVHTQIDLLVSFGGVVGLFLGGSILSLVELLYHVILGLISEAFRWSKIFRKPAEGLQFVKSRNEPQRPVPTVYRVLPLLDYYPNQRTSLYNYY